MVQLFLPDSKWSDYENDELVQKRKSLLKELESVLWSIMSSAGRSEVRLWLCNSVSCISSLSPRHQRDLFMNLLRSKPVKRNLAAQLLQLLFVNKPHKAGSILAKRSSKLENFFKGNPRRILQWFSNFSGTAGVEHRKGAKALSQFAFVNRDICWEELEWKGKHGQSPAMVATKPHYFMDLDVQRTVENFLEYVPEFWSSNEFAESLKDGEILCTDTKFFVDMFITLMYNEKFEEVWDVIDEFLMEESFSVLCHHLLIVLEEQDLFLFLDLICKFLKPKLEAAEHASPSFWLEVILSKCRAGSSINQLLLLNAVIGQPRQLLRLVREEGDQNEKEKVKDLVFQICAFSNSPDSFAPIMKECSKTRSIESIKLLALQSWAIYFRLTEDFRAPESWESLFVSNGIGFQKSDKYRLLNHGESPEDSGSEWDERPSSKHKLKKKVRHRKRRRRNRKLEDSSGDEGLDLDFSNNKIDLQYTAGDWMLSTDQYSTTWSSVDLPEHISKHCFLTWIKWAFSNI